MTIYDAAMAIVVVAGMVRGAWLGITWQLASIASLILGYVVSHQASAQFAPYFPGEPEVARSLAMAAVYVVVSASVFGLARLIRGVLHKLKFEAYDRHLGMLLGRFGSRLPGHGRDHVRGQPGPGNPPADLLQSHRPRRRHGHEQPRPRSSR